MRRDVSGLTRLRVAGFRALLAVPGCTPASRATSVSLTRCAPATIQLLGRFIGNRLWSVGPRVRSRASEDQLVARLPAPLDVSSTQGDDTAIVRIWRDRVGLLIP